MTGSVSVLVDGVLYEGWRSASLKRSIEYGAASFELEVTERWAGQPDRRAIRPGAACEIRVDGTAVLKGYVDDVAPEYDSASHRIQVSGRCKIGDLIDCAAVVDGAHEWSGIGLLDIATRICKPYGIAVQAQVSLGSAWSRFAIQPGESAFETLKQAARERAVLAVGDGLGTLVLTRAGAAGRVATVLELGRNIRSAQAQFSFKDRFSVYVTRAHQEAVSGLQASDIAQQQAKVNDAAVERYRPKVIVESQGDGVTLADLARWERQVSAGRSRRATYRVDGWQDGSTLWTPNTLVRVIDPYLDLDDDLLIVGVTLSINGTSRTAELDCAPADAFAVIPTKTKGAKSGPFFENNQLYEQLPDGKIRKVS